MDNLIFDRTLYDVDFALSNPSNTSFLKGSYNYIDLNRIETWCEYIQDLVNDIGLLEEKIILILKTNWVMTDFIREIDLQRIINNISILLDKLSVIGEKVTTTRFDYEKANIIERNLDLLRQDLERYKRDLRRCGTFNCGEITLCGEVI